MMNEAARKPSTLYALISFLVPVSIILYGTAILKVGAILPLVVATIIACLALPTARRLTGSGPGLAGATLRCPRAGCALGRRGRRSRRSAPRRGRRAALGPGRRRSPRLVGIAHVCS